MFHHWRERDSKPAPRLPVSFPPASPAYLVSGADLAIISEIERLRSRVQELESELEKRDQPPATAYPSQGFPEAQPAAGQRLAAPIPTLSDDELWRENQWSQKARGIGLYTGDGRVKQWFGPSSLFFFVSRMTAHLARFIEHPPPEHTIHWSSTNQSFTTGVLDPNSDVPGNKPMGRDPHPIGSDLTGIQEEYFIGLFWDSYFCSVQIVDEASFKELYRSLWTGTSRTRRPSALVDIILALCIQYDTTLPTRRRGGDRSSVTAAPDTKDTAVAGRYYYQRCQSLLLAEMECPTISTLQCHIFSVYYLCCASFQNMAHSTLALAVRTAHILGLHLEPPADLPRPERELRKRLWWTLYSIESKTCIKLGRPWSAPMSDTTCGLPADDHQLAILSGCAALATGNVTWLTYTLQSTKLVLAVRNVYVAFWHEVASVLSSSEDAAWIDQSPSVRERLGVFLQAQIAAHIDTWVSQVPEAIRCRRKTEDESPGLARPGTPFSVGTTELAIETFAPLWLQRQRIYLELLYHNLCLIIYRPLIRLFFPNDSTPTPAATACAEACVSHAIALTRITHQALSETDILKGHHEGFQWQWNAAITMIGFYLGSPLAPQTAAARAATDMAIEVFDIFGRHFAVGTRAARTVRELTAKTDFLLGMGMPPQPAEGSFMDGGGSGLATGSEAGSGCYVDSPWSGSGSHHSGSAMMVDSGMVCSSNSGAMMSEDAARLQDVLSGTLDVAFSVDSFNSFEPWNGSGYNFGDMWTFQPE